jgi:putative sugar O-methyltransferase
MVTLEIFYRAIDSVPKLLFLLDRRLKGSSLFSNSSKSDSDSTPYTKFIYNVNKKERIFKRFRRNYSYRVILEHVSYKIGKSYLNLLSPETINSYCENPRLIKLGSIGRPRKFYYRKLGWISPTILRYLYVNQNLSKIFSFKEIETVGEIGVGFGGQIAVTTEINNINSYAMYDLPPVLELSRKVLTGIGISMSRVTSKAIDPLTQDAYDLVISNYAFSELPYAIQTDYVSKILSNARCGYLTMNSGRTNYSGRSKGKMSLTELIALLPNAEVIEEDPLTGPDNYLIVWGHKK